ncbi:hypothetical protein V6N11_082305 [Hibiscus sabdariffa]|uniref:Uncharacterized protein n=1 Tax=Hibiscus sabdariffa TaxID=183260 RepID=A0ABR2PC56_9ROSI
MIEKFQENSNFTLNPRKHHRLDEKLPNTDNPHGTTLNALPADSRMPSYKEKLTDHSRLPLEDEENIDEDEIEILEGDVSKTQASTNSIDPPMASQPEQPKPYESSSFSPWIVVERKQRRRPKKQVDDVVNSSITPVVAIAT